MILQIYRNIQTNRNKLKIVFTKISNSKENRFFKNYTALKLTIKLANPSLGKLIFFTASSLSVYATYKFTSPEIVELDPSNSPTNREKRFIRFASIEYNNQLYMTPKDFLRSVIEAEPTNPNRMRRILTRNEIETIQKNTPSAKNGTKRLFRNLRHDGLISYTEYMFLRSILTKPSVGFKIAFDMLDQNGNQRIDKEEFLVMEMIFGNTLKAKRRTRDGDNEMVGNVFVNDALGLQRKHDVRTTLQIHFFGLKGVDKLSFKLFEKFMINLQLEVLEMEFSQYARGFPTITEHDFATILFRYTKLAFQDYQVYSSRLKERLTKHHEIPFADFYVFFQFLNNLEDFATALHMYTSAGYQITEEEFQRAAKISTGSSLNPYMVHTVFCLFDEDGDGTLSHGEFTMIMKHRIQRSSQAILNYRERVSRFNKCVKREIRN